jgi:cation diffusion facilitator CzcD-associated flavoprotein CzcO
VVVVGIGNSGVDIATSLVGTAASVELSSRRRAAPAAATRRRPPAAAHPWHSAASHRMQRRVGPPQLFVRLSHRPLRVPSRTRAATRPHGAAV